MRLAPEALFTIDVDAEVRKLTTALFEGPWVWPAELVRGALRLGASRVEVELSRRRLVVRDDGRPLDPSVMRDLAALLAAPEAGRRHAALVALEEGGFLCLAAVARAASGGLRLLSGSLALHLDAQGACHLDERPPGEGTILQAEGLRLPVRAARRHLSAALRFAPAEIRVDGRIARRGFGAAVAEAPLTAQPGRVAIPQDGFGGRLWLLQHGVVTAHVLLPQEPPFEAALEMGAMHRGAGPAALRAAITPFVTEVVEEAMTLAARAHAASSDPAVRRRLREVLLEGFICRRLGAEARTAPCLDCWLGRGRVRTRASFADLAAELDAAVGPLPALSPGESPDAYLMSEGPVWILDANERLMLSEALNARFELPPRREEATDLGRRLRETWAAFLEAVRYRLRSTFRGGRGRPLEPDELGPVERRFAAALAEGATVIFTAGSAPPRWENGRLYLPRHSEQVRAALRLYALDESAAYPAALALSGGHLWPPKALREAFRASVGARALKRGPAPPARLARGPDR